MVGDNKDFSGFLSVLAAPENSQFPARGIHAAAALCDRRILCENDPRVYRDAAVLLRNVLSHI